MRFFDADYLSDIVAEPRLREAIAKKVDQVLAEQTTVVYGAVFENGQAVDWSSVKTDVDTHVALLLAPKGMAIMSPQGSYVQTDKLSHSDLLKAKNAQIRAQQNELDQLRRDKS
jgi:hypothetical protein